MTVITFKRLNNCLFHFKPRTFQAKVHMWYVSVTCVEHNDRLPPVIDGGYYVFNSSGVNYISHGAEVLEISIVDLSLQGILVRHRDGDTRRHTLQTYHLHIHTKVGFCSSFLYLTTKSIRTNIWTSQHSKHSQKPITIFQEQNSKKK